MLHTQAMFLDLDDWPIWMKMYYSRIDKKWGPSLRAWFECAVADQGGKFLTLPWEDRKYCIGFVYK